MFMPITILLKSGENGYCTLMYNTISELREQVEAISASEDVESVTLDLECEEN